MSLATRRIFRLSLTVALTLAAAYALHLPMAYIAPIFALILTSKPSAPMKLKGLIGLSLIVLITLGQGLLLIPVLQYYPFVGFLLVAVGLYASNTLSIRKGKGALASLLTMGLTLISAAGLANFASAQLVIKAIASGVALTILCQWIIYPFFPEDDSPNAAPNAPPPKYVDSNWIALRATLIILPAWFMALVNPSMYLSVIMKSVSLGQQESMTNSKHAGRELLGSTFTGGFFAILFWFALKLNPTLWMFFLWALLFGIHFSCKLYGMAASRFPASFWINAWITMLILIGPAVQDSANGNDVYKAFAIRMVLFIAVTLYAWFAMSLLENIRSRRVGSDASIETEIEI